jgi:hypothetical protein
MMLRALMLSTAVMLAACTPPAATTASTDIYLGALEERPGSMEGEASRRVVRVLFRKDGAEWRALDAASGAPSEISWTIASRGADLGALTSRGPAATAMSADVGIQEIDADQTVPTVGERSQEFAGWAGAAIYRPLVAVSQPNLADPEAWAARDLDAGETQRLIQAFRAQFPAVTNCASPEANVPAPWAYTDADIAHGGALASSQGWVVANLTLTNYRCDGPPSMGEATPFTAQTFAISPEGEVTALGQGLTFVDAGDYDADGASELVFQLSDYNRGGYVIFYEHLAKHAEFAFSFH